MGLFNLCPECQGGIPREDQPHQRSLIVINHVCQNYPQPCGFSRKWYSQPFIGNIPAGNILLSASILFSGASPKKVIQVMKGVNVATIAYSSFIVHQRLYLQPAIVNTWERMQLKMVEDLKESEEKLVIGGDARNDSPGHTAKYGSYTFLEQNLNKVIHVELVQEICYILQKNEVANSYQMELEALKRGIAWLQTMELEMGTIITDCHMQVTAWIREELTKKEDIKHYFDVWHISKGIKKKLRAAAAKKDCGLINDWTKSITNHLYWCASSSPDGDGGVMAAKWASVVNHIMNIHVHENPLFPVCSHPRLDAEGRLKVWVQNVLDSKVAEELIRILQSASVMRGVKKMSPIHQTSSVENFHMVINHFSPKMMAYSYQSMLCRFYLESMYYNENAGRDQRTKTNGTKRWKISFPKSKGGDYVLQKVLDNPTHEYVNNLLMTKLALAGNKDQRQMTPALCIAPPPLAVSASPFSNRGSASTTAD
ncbi:uncharacterized protein [Apostichopus japonicus]|uniref:uncharacterized protein isoform X1 n=1 Tax=Stichopus japonicus TaxID=307972 RepID=UPI003AB87B3A